MNENHALSPEAADRMTAMIERRVKEAQTLLEERMRSVEAARALQAIEYERRLELLNGEHATLAQMKNDFVLRVVYEKDMDRLRLANDLSLRAAEEARQRQEAASQSNRRNTMIAVVGFVTALVGWGFTALFHFLPGAAN